METQELPPQFQDPPGRYRLCKNGAIFDNETKRFVAGPLSKHNPPEVIEARAKQMQQARTEKQRRLVLERIQEAAVRRAQDGLNRPPREPADAIAYGIAHLYERSLDGDEPLRDAVAAQRLVITVAAPELMPRAGQAVDGGAPVIQINISGQLAGAYAGALAERLREAGQDPSVIDGEWSEAEGDNGA